MWTEMTTQPGDPLPASWLADGWTLECSVRYLDGGCTWRLVPDQPIELEGHVARFLAAHDTKTHHPPLDWASRRVGLHDWRDAR